MRFELAQLTPAAYAHHRFWMGEALALAREAGAAGDVPVGAVVVDRSGHCLARAGNRKERDRNPTAHAEILAIQQASQTLQDWHLTPCTLYVTLEPCPMCTGAIIQARLGLLVYGCDDPKTGTVRSVLNLPDHPCSNHRLPVLAGIEAAACQTLLSDWFAQRRAGG
jgi:tRNA(adenine34) deaminase